MWAQHMRRALLSKYFLPPHQHPLSVNHGCRREAGVPSVLWELGRPGTGQKDAEMERKPGGQAKRGVH